MRAHADATAMLPIETARQGMRAAEKTFLDAARALEKPGASREGALAYRAAIESLIAAYDTVRMIDPRHRAI